MGAGYLRALTVQVILEYLHIWDLLLPIILDKDLRRHRTGSYGYDNISAILNGLIISCIFIGQYSTLDAKVMWKAHAPNKCKFFMWLAVYDRCWTADRRKVHNLQATNTCALCSIGDETTTYLLALVSLANKLGSRHYRRSAGKASHCCLRPAQLLIGGLHPRS